MSFTQRKPRHYGLCQPIPPQRYHEMRSMLFKVRFGQSGFPAVGKDDDLDKPVVAVVAVRDRINDGFRDDRPWNLELYRGLRALHPCTNAAVKFAEHKLHGLVDDFQQTPFVGLLRGDRLTLLRPEEMEAVNLCIVEEPARVLAEQKYGSIGRLSIPQQVEILQYCLRGPGSP
ncbi:hypothetical protein ES703_114710 [subsurface metagenome]